MGWRQQLELKVAVLLVAGAVRFLSVLTRTRALVLAG